MANYANLKATIAANIKQNGNEEITGPILQSVLTQMTTLLGSGWAYAGVATPATAPGTPDNNVFYITSTAGTYTNFGGLVVAENEVAILKYNGAWAKDVPGIATAAQVTQLGQKLYDMKVPVTGWISGKYYYTKQGVGNAYDTTLHDDVAGCRCVIVPVNPTYKYIVNGTGGVTPRLWIFADENNIILATSAASASSSGDALVLTPPATATQLVINNAAGYTEDCYILSSGDVDNLKDEVAELQSMSDVVDDLNLAVNGGEKQLSYELGDGYINQYGNVASGQWKHTDYVNVAGIAKLKFLGALAKSSTTVCYAFYDSELHATAIPYTTDSSITPSFQAEPYEVDVPSTAVSVRISLKTDWENSFYIKYDEEGLVVKVEALEDIGDRVDDLETNVGDALEDIATLQTDTAALDAKIGQKVTDLTGAEKYGYTENLNDASLWERGGIADGGGNMTTNPDNARNLRTITFIPSNVRFVHIPDSWRLDVFIYSADGTFEQAVRLANKKYALLGVDKKYRLQLRNYYGLTDVIPIADYAKVFMLSADSMFKKPIAWGNVDFSAYYRGRQSDYSLFNYSATYDQIIQEFDSLAATDANYITVTELGSSSNGKTLKSYDLKPISIAREFENYGPGDEGKGSTGASCEPYKYPPTFIFICGQHGFEKSSTFSMYYLMKDLIEKWDEDEVLRYLRTTVRIVIVPAINSWGIDNNSYLNANGVNLNRNWWSPNWTKYTGDNPSEASGDAPFDQPETQIARDLILSIPEAISVVDFHTAGSDSVPNVRSHFWAQLAMEDDEYYYRFMEANTAHARELVLFKKMYNLDYASNALGHITWENGNIGRLFQWATHKNYLGVTFEGFNGFYGQSSYTEDAKKANCESVGNWIMCVVREFCKD